MRDHGRHGPAAERRAPGSRPHSRRYPCLIDRDHHVADLYNMVNVPQAMWIDETGPHRAPARECRLERRLPAHGPRDRRDAARRLGRARWHEAGPIVAAVRDWVANGSASEHVFEPAGAKAHLQLPDADTVAAHAHFRLAQHLLRSGNGDEAAQHFAEASRLHPEFLEHLAAGGEERAERVRSRSRLLGKSRGPGRPALSPDHRHERHAGAADAVTAQWRAGLCNRLGGELPGIRPANACGWLRAADRHGPTKTAKKKVGHGDPGLRAPWITPGKIGFPG